MRDESSTEKTESITLRLDKRVLDKLRSYSQIEKTSINSVVNQFLQHSVDWDILAAGTGWIPIPKNILVAILDKLDDKTIVEVATKLGQTVPKDILLSMKGNSTIRDWVAILRSRARAAGFHYNEEEEKGKTKFITQHDMGIKWSKYFKTYYESAFNALGCHAEFVFTDNALVFKMDNKYLT